MNKSELMKEMLRQAKNQEEREASFYTCSVLCSLDLDNTELYEEYQEWLHNSKYFERYVPSVLIVNLATRDYLGKLSMFQEFLDTLPDNYEVK